MCMRHTACRFAPLLVLFVACLASVAHAAADTSSLQGHQHGKRLLRGMDGLPGHFTTTGLAGSSLLIDRVDMTSVTGVWGPGTAANVTFYGRRNGTITSGVLRYKVYESGVTHFIASNNTAFFECTNKGCDPHKPVSLWLSSTSGDSSAFVLTTEFIMPKSATPGAAASFSADFWGVSQVHYPYAFTATINYSFGE